MPSVTARTQTVDDYLRDLGKLEMITPEEETELAVRIQAGDDAAFKRMVEANLRFVVSVAKKYQNRGLDLLDLVNEGNIGLMKAALKFDPTRGFKFVPYASGGVVSKSSRPCLSRDVLSGSRSIRWVSLIKSDARVWSFSKRTSVNLLTKNSPNCISDNEILES